MRQGRGAYALKAIAALIALTALGGCATVPPPFAPGDNGSTPRDTVRSEPSSLIPTGKRTPPPAPAAQRSYVPADSLPSPEAQAVLSTLPEPLAPEERVPPRRRPRPVAIADSSTTPESGTVPPEQAPVVAPADSSGQGAADAPVPSPTQPLGDRPGALERMLSPDSTAIADSAARAKSPAASPRAGGGAPTTSSTSSNPRSASPDTCFRVQVGAPAELVRANHLRDAAASQLLVPMVVEKERGLYKVRTRDCYSREASDRLRERAVGAGFHGVFRISGKPPESRR